MKHVTVCGIFPKPVSQNELDRPFTEVELSFFENQKFKTNKNEGNTTSQDTYILNNPELAELAEEILQNVNLYVNSVMIPANNLKPYITQSWLNYTNPGEFHHRHSHSNSIISGVLYINADPQQDKIYFFDEQKGSFNFINRAPNPFNNSSVWFSVKTGDLLLFPSYLQHKVETTTSTETRISLAFNVFMKGTLGSNLQLTELII